MHQTELTSECNRPDSDVFAAQKDMKEPYDWDAYASAFFPQAEKLVSEASNAENEGHKEKASELFL